MSKPCILNRVVLIQEHLPHYRVRFFDLLRQTLRDEGLEFRLIHGRSRDSRMVSEALTWAEPVGMKRLGPFTWHQLGKLCSAADLIIVPQEVKYLHCHVLQLKSWLGGAKFAFWGHGRNFQIANADAAPERLKRFLSRRADWWFAYNELSAEIVRELGFPAERITTVGNAIDTVGLTRRHAELRESDIAALRQHLGLPARHVAVYTGGLYATKRIPFLIEAAKLLREQVPDFHLLVIGDGEERPLVREAAEHHPWIHDLGPMGDEGKVPYWALADVLLMPGGVGLVILDSFALGVPMITTETHLHGPEISYLRNGENGLLIECGDSPERYATAVAALLTDPERLAALQQGARASATEHTLEAMVANFAVGVRQALANGTSSPS